MSGDGAEVAPGEGSVAAAPPSARAGATRSAIGGWVEKSLARPVGRNGLAIIRWLCATSRSSGGSGSAWVPACSLRSALASASGSRVSSAPDASAWNSRLRLIASWMIDAAIGPRMTSSRLPSTPPPSSSSLRPPKNDANIAMCDRNMITLASAPATEEIRMSRL